MVFAFLPLNSLGGLFRLYIPHNTLSPPKAFPRAYSFLPPMTQTTTGPPNPIIRLLFPLFSNTSTPPPLLTWHCTPPPPLAPPLSAPVNNIFDIKASHLLKVEELFLHTNSIYFNRYFTPPDRPNSNICLLLSLPLYLMPSTTLVVGLVPWVKFGHHGFVLIISLNSVYNYRRFPHQAFLSLYLLANMPC